METNATYDFFNFFFEVLAAYEVDSICLVLRTTGAVDETSISSIPLNCRSSLESPPIFI